MDDNMANAVLEFKTGGREALRTFATNASSFATLMREHIYKRRQYPLPNGGYAPLSRGVDSDAR